MTSAVRGEEQALGAAAQRRVRLRALVDEQGFCTVAELAAALAVSEMTVRRDIAVLVTADATLRSVHGGISAMPAYQLAGSDYTERRRSVPTLKQAIARRALELLPRAGVIAIDAGTTTVELARLLPSNGALKLVTHSLPVLQALAARDDLDVTCLGGTLQHSPQAFAGPGTIAAIGELMVDTFFMGASGVHARGVFCGNDLEAVTKRALIGVSGKVVLLTDSSKFLRSAMVRTCALTQLSAVVVDDGLAPQWRRRLDDAGVTVHVVATPAASADTAVAADMAASAGGMRSRKRR